MQKKVISTAVIALFLIGMLSTTSISVSNAHTADEPFTTDLVAGQNTDVGDVLVWNDGDYLYVKYMITEPEWCLVETHLQVATSLDGIPQKNGNPIPGRFTLPDGTKSGMEHNCITEYTYQIDLMWDPDTDLYIAAHAVVQSTSGVSETAWGAGLDFPGKNWATYFEYTVQSTGPIVTPGSPTWTKGAGVRYKGYNTGKEIFLGPMTTSSATPRTEADYNEFGSVGSKTYQITFAFDKAENKITTTITSPDVALTFDFDTQGAPGCACAKWDAMEIVVRDSRTDSGVALQNVMLDSFALGNFATVNKAGTPGWQTWTVTGFDFSESFTVTANLVVDGYNGNESIKVEFNVGCLTP